MLNLILTNIFGKIVVVLFLMVICVSAAILLVLALFVSLFVYFKYDTRTTTHHMYLFGIKL